MTGPGALLVDVKSLGSRHEVSGPHSAPIEAAVLHYYIAQDLYCSISAIEESRMLRFNFSCSSAAHRNLISAAEGFKRKSWAIMKTSRRATVYLDPKAPA